MEIDFETKKKMLFESLDSAEKNLQGTSLEQTKHDYNLQPYRQQRKRNREVIEKYKNKDSLFKRPDLPINKCLRSRQRPAYEKNPNKWQHYSLDDVDTSDRSNTAAAFSFLKEIEDRKDRQSEMDDKESGSSKIIFKKSIRLKQREDETDPQIGAKKVQGLKIIMPEYVVGEKKARPKKSRDQSNDVSSKKSSHSNLKLSHLEEDEEEDE